MKNVNKKNLRIVFPVLSKHDFNKNISNILATFFKTLTKPISIRVRFHKHSV